MGAALPRLKKRSDFLRIAEARRKHAALTLVLQVARQPGSAGALGPRIGFTASRKVGGAVQRNRAKRRLRAAADHILPGRALSDHDYVLIARAGTVDLPFATVLADLSAALARLKAIAPVAEGATS